MSTAFSSFEVVCRLGRIRPRKDASGAVVVYRMIHWFVECCLAPVCSAESTASTNQDTCPVFFESSDGAPKMHCYAGLEIQDAPPSAMEINEDALHGLQPYGGVEELLYDREWMVQGKGGVLNMFLVSPGALLCAPVFDSFSLHWLGFAECGCIVRTLSATQKEWWRSFSPSGHSLGQCFELVVIGPSETFQLGVLVGATPCLVLDFAFRGWCGWWQPTCRVNLIHRQSAYLAWNQSISKLDFDCGACCCLGVVEVLFGFSPCLLSCWDVPFYVLSLFWLVMAVVGRGWGDHGADGTTQQFFFKGTCLFWPSSGGTKCGSFISRFSADHSFLPDLRIRDGRLRLGGGVSGQPGAVDERRLDFQLLIYRVTFVVMLEFLSAFELTHLTLVWVGALFAARTLKLFVALGGQGK
eukprot:g37600.t1